MTVDEMEATDQMDPSSTLVNVRIHAPAAPATGAEESSRAGSAALGGDNATPHAAPKRKMVITHDKFTKLRELIILHLLETERGAGHGTDRDELIDWYLEAKESEIQDVEELEYEKELITKMLRRLVKVGLLAFSDDEWWH